MTTDGTTDAKAGAKAGAATMAAAMFRAGWRRLRRDRTALAFTVLVPVGVALVLGGIYTSTAGGTARVGVVVEAPGPVAADLAARLDASPVLETVRYADSAALDRAVLRREIEAGVVVPAAVEGLLAAPGPASLGPGAAAGASSAAGAPVRLVGAPGVQAPGGLRAVIEAAAADTSAVAALARAEQPAEPGGLAFQAVRARPGDRRARPRALRTTPATSGPRRRASPSSPRSCCSCSPTRRQGRPTGWRWPSRAS